MTLTMGSKTTNPCWIHLKISSSIMSSRQKWMNHLHFFSSVLTGTCWGTCWGDLWLLVLLVYSTSIETHVQHAKRALAYLMSKESNIQYVWVVISTVFFLWYVIVEDSIKILHYTHSRSYKRIVHTHAGCETTAQYPSVWTCWAFVLVYLFIFLV